MSSISETGKSHVGIFPKGWEVRKVDQFANVRTGPFGSLLHQDDYVHDGTPIITVEHLGDRGIIHKNLPMVSDNDKQRLSAYLLQKHDIVFSRVGSVDRNAIVKDDEEGWLFSGRLLRIRVGTNDVYSPYLSYFFSSEPFRNRIRNVAVGQTMASLNTQIMKNIEVVLPPFPEQHAIAEVLSDVDALIEAQEALIEKKRLIKQGVMQELLTGKRRLPGFGGEWKHEILTDVCTLETGKRPKGGVSEKGDIPSLGGENIYNENGLNLENINKVSTEFYNNMNQGILKNNDVLINKDGANTGKVALYTNSPFKKACINEHLFIMRGNENLDNRFLYNLLCLEEINYEIKKFITSSAQPGLNRSFVEKIIVKLPQILEQQAIAKIIMDIEIEIDLQKKYKMKIESVKQGMMEELLTGRTRLV